MVKNFKKIMACLLAFAVIFTCIGSALATVSAETVIITNANGKTTDVGIWYTTYNCNEFWDCRFAGTEETGEKTVGYNALLPDGSYGVPFSGNTDIIDFHIKEMADAGIDFILFDLTNGGLTEDVTAGWYSKDDKGNPYTNDYAGTRWIVQYAKLTAERLSKWNDSHDWKIRYAVSVGTHNEVLGDQEISRTQLAESQAEGVKEIFLKDKVIADDYYTFDGKPLITLYDWDSYTKDDQDLAENIEKGNGIFSEFTVRYSGTGEEGQYNWYNSGDGIPKTNSEVMTVAPGHSSKKGDINVSRQDGKTYEDAWNAVLEAETTPRVVLLSSFNDYMENTALFVTDTSGAVYDNGEEEWDNNYQYWDMTVEYIQRLREEGGDSAIVDTGFKNVALNAAVTAPIGAQNGSNALSKATDGEYDVASANNAVLNYDSSNNLACYEVDLVDKKTINNVTLKLSRQVANERPRDIAVDVYVGGAWLRVAEIHAAKDENIWQVSDKNGSVNVVYFNFAPVECTKFRVTGNRAGTRDYNNSLTAGYNFRVGEIEAYNNNTITEADYTGIATATVAGTEIAGYKSINYALSTNGAEITSNLAGKVSKGYDLIIDGNTANYGGAKVGDKNISTLYYQIDFEGVKDINQVVLTLRTDTNDATQNKRKLFLDYAVDVLLENGQWQRTAGVHFDNDQMKVVGKRVELNFAPVKGSAIRVSTTIKGQNQILAGITTPEERIFFMGEIEAYYNPAITEYTGIHAGGEVTVINVDGKEKTYDSTIEAYVSNNYALSTNGAKASSSLPKIVANWGSDYSKLIDGSTSNNNYIGGYPSTNETSYASGQSSDVYFQVDFAGTKHINQVVVTVRNDQDGRYCLDYAVDVLLENGLWERTAYVHYNYTDIKNGSEIKLNFAPVECSAIRVSTTAKGHAQVLNDLYSEYRRVIALGEIEAYYNSAVYEGNYTGIHTGGEVTVTNANGDEKTYDSTIREYASENYALSTNGAKASSSLPEIAWDGSDYSKLIDGNTSNDNYIGGYPSTNGSDYNSGESADVYFQVDFDGIKNINQVVVKVRNNEDGKYCLDYAVDVLLENGNWERTAYVHFNYGDIKNGSEIKLNFAPVECSAIRVSTTAKGHAEVLNDLYSEYRRVIALGEIEAYYNPTITEDDYTGIHTGGEVTVTNANGDEKTYDSTIREYLSNFALGQKVTTSNTNWSDLAGNYPADRIADGSYNSSNVNSSAISNYTDGLASFTVNYDKAYIVNKVVLRLSTQEINKRPDEYVVDVLTADGWVRVGVQADKKAVSVVFYFEAVECTAVRITGNAKYNRELYAGGSNQRSTNFRINEIETYFDNSVTDEMYTGTKSALEAKYTANIQGDVDGNTWVNALDLAYALNWYTRARTRYEGNKDIIDTNRDGKYDIRDYLKVKEILAERDPRFDELVS